MNYYFLESQYPRRGFISGGTTFTPELGMNYVAIENPLPEGTTAEVELLSTVRNLKVDYFETITGTRHVSDRFKALLEETKQTYSLFRQLCVTTTVVRLKKPIGLYINLIAWMFSIMKIRNMGAKRSLLHLYNSPHVRSSKLYLKFAFMKSELASMNFLCWII
ncbi:hypothetical protein V4D07_01900 [Paenibacillus taichungensis]